MAAAGSGRRALQRAAVTREDVYAATLAPAPVAVCVSVLPVGEKELRRL
jgi:hypothetical protein